VDRVRRLASRVVATKNDCAFADLAALLLAQGFVQRQPGGGGSHYTFKRGSLRITVPRARPVKRRYVEDVLALIEELLPCDDRGES
jgi:hypothetical protein